MQPIFEIDYKSLFEAVPTPCLILDPNFTIVAVNDAYLSATMTKRNEILRRNIFDVFPDNPEDPVSQGERHLRASLGRVLKNKATDTMAIQKYDIRRPESEGGGFEVRYWSPINSPVMTSGEVVLIIHRVEDVTDFVNLQNQGTELKSRFSGMEAEIYQRTQELKKAIDELALANQELESFSHSVSHDLRAPLRGMIGFSQALIEDYKDKLDQDGLNYLQRIKSASVKMGQLIDGLLNLSKIGRRTLTMTSVDLSVLAEEIVTDLRTVEPTRKNVEVTITPNMSAQGDPALLRAVLTNLIGNAWKFTSRKEISVIEFSVEKTDQDLVYYVRDNGAGFNMEYSNKLFGAFQRLHKHSEFEGTGIGLATAQRIIHRHGGTIWAQSKINEGATFSFTLSGQRPFVQN